MEDKKIRLIVHKFQKQCAYNPPKKFKGSILDGRDITSVIIKDATIKFFITANVKVSALRRFKELKKLKVVANYLVERLQGDVYISQDNLTIH